MKRVERSIPGADSLLKGISTLFYPDICAVCDESTDGADLESGVCKQCWQGVREIGSSVCSQCGIPLGSEEPGKTFRDFKCSACRLKKRTPFSAMRSMYYYESPLREIFHLFKFQGMLSIGELLAESLAQALIGNSLMTKVDIIVPIPLHLFRRFKRGFNQSEVIAEAISQRLGLPMEAKAVSRAKNTAPQSIMETSQRRSNLKDAFRVKPELVKGKRVLLVDDVVTTGSTVMECCRALKRAGAKDIKVVTLARAESF